ncbi:hypothetical protein H6P81_001088 [Aristolochia fimbriata]|uniref:Uncharacterized protein n=1 Tax=Aristolochia fimbriata TaxID=158543 RepID=A0AAV7F8K0_ARIFI|nr:hypothetical protein H6P81_001088 [Aristolochia fimbriata]
MGSCFSSEASDSVTLSAAKVISINGALREFPVPVTVSHVLQYESTSSCFLCNSDKLFFDQHIPALNPNDHLQVGQIYFVLPNTKLQYPLTASDMAALAVKASIAMVQASKGKGRRKKIRVSPLLDASCEFPHQQDCTQDQEIIRPKRFDKITTAILSPAVSRSGSVRRLQRNASSRAKLAIRSFRMRLSTIHEGTVVE